MSSNCPFCNLPESRIIYENDYGVIIRDGYPISIGHTLIIPNRHVDSYFYLQPIELLSLLDLIHIAKIQLDIEFNPDSYNIGINDGLEAGQTVPHLHIHLIPRYKDDVDDPKGGVRWIIPEKADYWSNLT